MSSTRSGQSSAPARSAGEGRYVPPTEWATLTVGALNNGARGVERQQLLRLGGGDASAGPSLYAAGDVTLLHRRAVAIVGSRKASAAGRRRASQLARNLSDAGVVVVSGLAVGIDTAAHHGALRAGGRTVAVIGTPLDVAYPAANKRLQEQIYREHLLVSPFEQGERVYPENFPSRNKVMAALTDATVIIEASDTSGALHQAAECKRMKRPLLIPASLVHGGAVTWPADFLEGGHALVLQSADDVLRAIEVRR